MHVRLTVPIHPVGETHHARPLSGFVTVLAATTVAHDHRALFEVAKRPGDRRPVRGEQRRCAHGVQGHDERKSARRGEDQVITKHVGATRGLEHTRHVVRVSTIARAPEPPPRTVKQTLEFESAVLGEIGNVSRTTSEDS
jgi:hypothetical protein